MISMTVGDDDEIEPLQVDPQRLDVVGEDVGVIPGVEENAFAGVFNQRGESPVAAEISPRPEGVVQDGDAMRFGRGRPRRARRRAEWGNGKEKESQEH